MKELIENIVAALRRVRIRALVEFEMNGTKSGDEPLPPKTWWRQ